MIATKLTVINFCLIVHAAASQYADDTLHDVSLLQTRIGIQALKDVQVSQNLDDDTHNDLEAQVSQDAARAGENAVHSAVLLAVKENRMVTADLLDGLRSPHDAHLYGMGHSVNSTHEEAAEKTCCDGSLVCAYAGCKINNVIVDFDLLRTAKQPNVWLGPGEYPRGSIQHLSRIICEDHDYNSCYEELNDTRMFPLINSTTYEHWREPHMVQPGLNRSGTAFMVIRDGNNIFHQMGSVIASLEALQHFGVEEADQIIFCDGEESSTTDPLWSPVLGKSASYASVLHGRAQFRDVIIPRNVLSHWWWNVWDKDTTDRSMFFQTLRSRVVRTFAPDTKQQNLITVIDRAGDRHRVHRMLYNLPELIVALNNSFPEYTVESKDFGSLPWISQLQQVRSSNVLMSNHGAGLVWGIFLPKGSILMELLGTGQSNNYFFNEASWRRDIKYLKWQNRGRELEVYNTNIDNDFQNNIEVNCDEVVSILKLGLL